MTAPTPLQNTIALSYTGTGHEGWDTILASANLPAFTGAFTINYSQAPTTGTSWTLSVRFTQRASETVCWSASIGPLPGSSTVTLNNSVNDTPANWHCFNWDTMELYLGVSGSITAGQVLSMSITAAGLPSPPPCQYGTQAASSAGVVSVITGELLDTVLTAVGAPELTLLFGPLVGLAIDTGVLCGSGPPTVPTFTGGSLLDTVGQKLSQFQALAWYTICQCTPAPTGSPAPIPFPTPTLPTPPGFPVPPAYSCTDSDVCATLLYILKRLDEMSTGNSISLTQTNIVNNNVPALNYQLGAAHTGLTGSGTLSVSGDVGIRVDITANPTSPVLPGATPYIFDVGWVSVSDGGAMLQEKRITRTSMEWFPVEMSLATVVGYYTYSDTVLTITELLPVTH